MTSAQNIITSMQSRGFDLTLSATGDLVISPASRLIDSERALIRDNRAAIIAHFSAANDPQQADPDRHSHPHTEAANSQELARMARRLATFNRLGLSVFDAERQADKLLTRDREHDDRRMCLECSCLTGGMGGWRCTAFRQRGARDPGLPHDLVGMLQRCLVFVAGEPSASVSSTTARPSNGPKMPSLVNAPRPWLSASETAASKEYHQHHADCPQCQAAGRGHTKHCGAGAALWNDYTKGNAK